MSNIVREKFTGMVGRQLSHWYKEDVGYDRSAFCCVLYNSFTVLQKTSKRHCEIVKRAVILLQTVDKCNESTERIFRYEHAVSKIVVRWKHAEHTLIKSFVSITFSRSF